MRDPNPYSSFEADLRAAIIVCASTSPLVASADGRGAATASGRMDICDKPCWHELRRRVVAFAAAMHDRGAPPESVLREMKAVFRSADPIVEPSSPMMTAAVAWCIEGYYADGPRAN
jgi:hypothetical protein